MTSSISVLHVDDEPSFTDLVRSFLNRQSDGFDIETANRVDEGLEHLATDVPDCIVSDYEMPGKNGIEFLKTVRSKWSDLPFILYTGKGSEEVASDALSADATDYIQKQSATDHYALLANRIQNAVEQYHAQAAAQRTDERYHNLVDTAPIPILLFDTDSRLVYANNAAVTFLNADSYAELENEPFTEFLHSDDQEKATERFQTLISEQEHAPEIEYRVRAVDGKFKRATVATAYGYYRGEEVAQAMIHH